MTSPLRDVMTGTATKYLLLVVNVGLGILLMPFTVRHLGASEYGLWMLVSSLTYYFQLLDLGYGSGLVRHVADADARGDVDGVNRILSTFVVVYAGLGLAAGIGTIAMMLWAVPRFPRLSPTDIHRGQLVLAMIGIRTVVGFPMTVFGAATTARQRFALNNAVAIVIALANGAVTYAVLAAGHGLLTLVACTSALGIASYGAYAWTARRAFPELRIRPWLFSRGLVRDVTTFSVYLFIIDIAIQIGFNLDNVVVGAALGTSAVAVYAVTLRLADYQRQLCNQFNGLLFPIVVRLRASGSAEALQTMLIEGTRIALVLVTGVTIGVIGFGRPLLGDGWGRVRKRRGAALRAGADRHRARGSGSARQHPARHRPSPAGGVRIARRGDRESRTQRDPRAPVRHAGRGDRDRRADCDREPVHPAAAACRQVRVPLAHSSASSWLRSRRPSRDRGVRGAADLVSARIADRDSRSRKPGLPRLLLCGVSVRIRPGRPRALPLVCARPADIAAARGRRRDGNRLMTAAPGRVSVIIATYNRAALLDDCLAHLEAQRLVAGDEIIVVDNGSTDTTAAVVARHQRSSTTPLRLLHEARPGKSHAIARALAAAAGDLLVFTDDDVNVGAGWLDAIRAAMSDPAIAVAGGPVAARWEPAVPSWFRRAIAQHARLGAPIALLDYGARRVELGERTLLGANLAVRRDVFTRSAASDASRQCATRCSPARITSYPASPASGYRVYCRTRSSSTGCRRHAPASRTCSTGFSGPASRTRSWTTLRRRRAVLSRVCRST
jgi:hypothetical protein